jgi:hypothetical protein
VPHRKDKRENNKSKEKGDKQTKIDAPGRHATLGRRGSAAPRLAPG